MFGTSTHSVVSDIVDKRQAKIGKEILHVRDTAEAAGVLCELGWTASSSKAWLQRILFWWRLGKSPSRLLHLLEWQAEQYETTSATRGVSEYNWWRVTKSEIDKLSAEVGLSCKELRALPRKTFRTIVRRVSWKRELKSRLDVMKDSARLSHIARELQTRQLRNPNLFGWEAASYLEHVSSRFHIRLIAMTRLGLLPLEIETGRWQGLQREKRLCVSCNTQIGDTDHFLRGCVQLSTATCAHLGRRSKR